MATTMLDIQFTTKEFHPLTPHGHNHGLISNFIKGLSSFPPTWPQPR